MRTPFAKAALCLAILSSTGTALAQSGVTMYGIVDVTVRYAGNATAAGDSAGSVADGAYTGSRWGLRGTEDLGDGMKVYFNIEQGFAPSTGTLQQTTATANYGQSAAPVGRAWGRASFVGLSTSLGSISIGRQYTLAHDMSGRFQPQSNPNQDSLSVFSGHHVARQDNMVKYNLRSGAWGVALSATAGSGNGKAHGLAASYTARPFDVVVYAQNMNSANGTETRKIVGLGGAYELASATKLFLGAMQRTHRTSLQRNQVWTAGVNHSLTPNLVATLSYTQDRQSGTSAGSRKVAFGGLDYLLSKRSDVYIEIDNNQLSGSFPLPSFMGTRSSATGMSVGIRHRF